MTHPSQALELRLLHPASFAASFVSRALRSRTCCLPVLLDKAANVSRRMQSRDDHLPVRENLDRPCTGALLRR